MANRWGIPKDIEEFVSKKDTKCVYCGIIFSTENNSRKNKPSWEHIVNDIRINGTDNIAYVVCHVMQVKVPNYLKIGLKLTIARKKK